MLKDNKSERKRQREKLRNKLEIKKEQQEKLRSQIRALQKKQVEKEEKQTYAFLKRTKLIKIIFDNLESFKDNDEIIEIINESAKKIELIVQTGESKETD